MKDEKQVIAAYLRSALAERNLEPDESIINIIHSNVQLIDRPKEESEETRTVRLEMDSTGKITAESIKLYNIAQISTYDLLGFIGKEVGILLFDDTAKQMIYSLVMLLHEFYPKLKVAFNEQDAQVLFAIAQMGEKEFTTEELSNVYHETLKENLSEDKLEASLQTLVNHMVVKRTAVRKYRLREKIKNLSRVE